MTKSNRKLPAPVFGWVWAAVLIVFLMFMAVVLTGCGITPSTEKRFDLELTVQGFEPDPEFRGMAQSYCDARETLGRPLATEIFLTASVQPGVPLGLGHAILGAAEAHYCPL